MAKLHFIGGEKGGVGKSFTARLLAQYYIDNKLEFAGFDTDESHPTFSRFYSDYTRQVSVKSVSSLDDIIHSAEKAPERDIIVDLAAQTWSPVWQWMAECDLVALMKELGFTTCLWQVMDDGADCANLLQKQLQNLEETQLKLILVLNEARGGNFTTLRASDSYEQAMALGAKELVLNPLNADVVQKIDYGNNSFWSAVNNASNLSIVERSRARVWVRYQYKKLEQVLEATVDEMLDELESNIISGNFKLNVE